MLMGDLQYKPVVDTVTDPLFMYPLIAFCCFQVVMYYSLIRLFPNTFPTEKQKGWILTAANAFVLTIASIPFIYAFVRHDMQMDTAPIKNWHFISKPTCAFFISYLWGDLLLGYFLYPTQMNFWSGYFHHTLYTFMVTNLLQWDLHNEFIVAGIMEAPTFIMAVAQIDKRFRNDKLFGSVFFATRICFHLYYTVHLAFFAYPKTLIFLYPTLILPLHVMWFNGWLKQQRRIKSAKNSPGTSSPASEPISLSSSTTSPSTIQIQKQLMALLSEDRDQARKRLQDVMWDSGVSMDSSSSKSATSGNKKRPERRKKAWEGFSMAFVTPKYKVLAKLNLNHYLDTFIFAVPKFVGLFLFWFLRLVLPLLKLFVIRLQNASPALKIHLENMDKEFIEAVNAKLRLTSGYRTFIGVVEMFIFFRTPTIGSFVLVLTFSRVPDAIRRIYTAYVFKQSEDKKVGVAVDEKIKHEKSKKEMKTVVAGEDERNMKTLDGNPLPSMILEEGEDAEVPEAVVLASASFEPDDMSNLVETNNTAQAAETVGGDKGVLWPTTELTGSPQDLSINSEAHESPSTTLVNKPPSPPPISTPSRAPTLTRKQTFKSSEATTPTDLATIRVQTSHVAATALTKLHTTFGSNQAISSYLNDRLLIAANAWAFFMMDLAALLTSAAMALLFTLPASYALGGTPVSKAFCQGQGDPLEIFYKLLFGVFWMVFLEFWILVVESRLVGFEWKMLVRKMENAPVALNVFACFWMMSLSSLSVILLVEGGMYGTNWGCYARGRI
ncbi:hypothetical protein HDV05_007920 [Chytridiales sp. JEL 0842]|nr:hypothetical protein HDV05_007920 [Chytridiales sp. JEL 0842]